MTLRTLTLALLATSALAGMAHGQAVVTPGPSTSPFTSANVSIPSSLSPAQRLSCSVTTTSGQTAATIGGSCAFTSADVGKAIVIYDDGTALTTAPILTINVTSPGNSYTTVPGIVATGGSGNGFLGQANMGLSTAAVVSGGVCPTPGTYTFTVSGGIETTVAQFNGTVSGGVLSGTLTPTQAGSYQSLPSTSAASVTGGGCTTAPTVSSTWSLPSVTVLFTGYQYPVSGTTVAPSSGNATLTVTLGTPVAAPLSTTIAAVGGANAITLGTTNGQSLTGNHYVSWGFDNSAAIQAMIASAGTGSGYAYIPSPPNGEYWGVTSPIQIDPSANASWIVGAGSANTIIMALAPMSYVAYKSTSIVKGIKVSDIGFDGNKIATSTCYFAADSQVTYNLLQCKNAASFAEIVAGDGVTNGAVASEYYAPYARIDAALYNGDYDSPLHAIVVNETDSEWFGGHCIGGEADEFNVSSTGFNTKVYGTHCSPNGAVSPTEGFNILAFSQLFSSSSDNSLLYGYYVGANNVVISGGAIGAGSPATLYGAYIAPSITNVAINGVNLTNIATSASNAVVYGTPIATNLYVYGNAGATDYSSLPTPVNGDPTTLASGQGALGSITATSVSQASAYGQFALAKATGASDTAIGYFSGHSATTGNSGTYVGAFAGNNFTTASSSIAIGTSACSGAAMASVTGLYNICIGKSIGGALSGAANNNILIGGNLSAAALTTGNSDILIGPGVAPSVLATGVNDLLIGAAIDTPGAGTSNYINIEGIWTATGIGTPSTSASTHFGSQTFPNVTTGTNADFACFGAGGLLTLQTSACTISSLRFKEDVLPMTAHALPIIARMTVDSYRLKPTVPANRDPNARSVQYGLIAENIAKIVPECAIYEPDMKTPKSYRQECVIALLVKADQELLARVHTLESRK